jgi:NlpC/P60 family putative phage cell wall peptidase
LRGVWRELYGTEPEKMPAYTRDWSEPGSEETLWLAAMRHLVSCDPRTPVRVGEVLLFRMRDSSVAKHLGLAAGQRQETTFIHAYSGHGVIESPLSLPWRRRVVARFEFP